MSGRERCGMREAGCGMRIGLIGLIGLIGFSAGAQERYPVTSSTMTNVVTSLAPQPLQSATPLAPAAAPLAVPILGVSYVTTNTPYGLWLSYGVAAGQWAGSFQLNGFNILGSDTNMPLAAAGQVLYGNGNTAYMLTNVGTLGAEQTVLISQRDPKQGTYICFNAPKSGSGAGQVMGSAVDFAMGLGGWVYGSNTLGGVAIGYDGLIALNPPVNLHFTTTGYLGNGFGCSDFYAYDATGDVHHWAKAINGNGAFANAGYVDAMSLDAKGQILTVNSTATLATNVNLNGRVTLNGTNAFGAVSEYDTTGANQGQLNMFPSHGLYIGAPSSGQGANVVLDSRQITAGNTEYWWTSVAAANDDGATNNGKYVLHNLNGVQWYVDGTGNTWQNGMLTVNGAGTSTMVDTSSGAGFAVASILGPNCPSTSVIGNGPYATVGRANSAQESLGIAFQPIGSGSANNSAGFSLYGSTAILNIYKDAILIGTASATKPPANSLNVQGTMWVTNSTGQIGLYPPTNSAPPAAVIGPNGNAMAFWLSNNIPYMSFSSNSTVLTLRILGTSL